MKYLFTFIEVQIQRTSMFILLLEGIQSFGRLKIQFEMTLIKNTVYVEVK